MSRFAKVLCVGLALLSPLPALSEGRSIIVLDASGSMWGQIEGRTKLEIVREALAEVLVGVPPETELGLIAYGHRSQGDCNDIELIVPPAAGTAAAISDAAQNLQFLGKTPLTESVRQAAVELRSSEEKATVILITDGIETCNADPCALGAELEATGVDFTAHVVGFGLSAEEGAKVACLADSTGGLYIQASDAGALKDALQTTVVVAEPVPEPEPEAVPEPEPAALTYNFAPQMVLSEGGDVVPDVGQAWELYQSAAAGQRGERLTTEYGKPQITVPPGTYRLVARIGLAEVEQEIVISDTELAAPTVVMNAGTIIVRPRGSDGGPIESSAAVNLTNSAGIDSTSYGEWETVFPAGDVNITVKVGEATVSQPADLAPGQVLELDMIAGAGLAVVDAYYVEGVIMDTTQHSVEIVEAKTALDGSRASITTSYGPGQQFVLPPGDYVAIVKQGIASAEVPFSVKVGERVDVPVILNAGVLAITATGANSIEVLDARIDLAGNRKSLAFEYNEAATIIAPGGEFLIVVSRGDVTAEATATVIPGERSEVTVP
jgi:Ca-activated chloride channel homolog